MKKAKNVLSIDMDYIMAPCISMYNDCAGSEEFRNGDFWTRVNMIRNIDRYLEYDPEKLVFVTDVLSEAVKKCDSVMFAQEHDMILEQLLGDGDKGDEFVICNIDHHHDIYYCQEQKEEVERFDFACLADWVYYLGNNGLIRKYHWVRNENSVPFDEGERSELTFPANDYTGADAEEMLRETNFDYVFCCRSKEYFPDRFGYLFEMQRKLSENIRGEKIDVWNRPFCIDGKSRHVK